MRKEIKIEIILLTLILLFAFFLRVYSLSSPFWVDEATSAMASKMILEKGFPLFDSRLKLIHPFNLDNT